MNAIANVRLVPDQAQYRPGEPVRIVVTAACAPGSRLRCRWSVHDLHHVVMQGEGEWQSEEQADHTEITIDLPAAAVAAGSGAYGVFATVYDEEGNEAEAETAFDVAEHWREAPRYGFLSDFAPDEADDGDVEFLNRHHINVVQFYDWMYRHDQLLPEADVFTDPLGRTISLAVVLGKIEALRKRGIASLAYAAVYASLPDYAQRHPEQLLYRSDGTPYRLGDYFYIMDISPGSAWTERIVGQFAAAIEWGFDGLHLDQYGFPKQAIRLASGAAEVVRLQDLYPAIIDRTREDLPHAGLIFNNVGSYPVHTTARARQDAVYIEVWDPASRLADLQQLIRRARELSGKQVVLAAYLPAFHPERQADPRAAEIGATVAMAAIFANGGYHLLLGERGNVLADPYYPKYGSVSASFARTLTRYYDFIVMYRELLFDSELEDISVAYTGGINNELTFRHGETAFTPEQWTGAVWTIVKEKIGFRVIHLINLVGLDNDVWHAPKQQQPTPLADIEVTIEAVERIEGVYYASPDEEADGGTATIRARQLPYEWVSRGDDLGRFIRFTVPRLDYWGMIYVQTEPGAAAEGFDFAAGMVYWKHRHHA